MLQSWETDPRSLESRRQSIGSVASQRPSSVVLGSYRSGNTYDSYADASVDTRRNAQKFQERLFALEERLFALEKQFQVTVEGQQKLLQQQSELHRNRPRARFLCRHTPRNSFLFLFL
mmetsp:Transcript_32772/g.61106  ORF Transcript_32772/g.61106 Transcript_32772/m.61106 type:complete len:118 (-) Transcript_32772:96-449(-)